jgi:hypothetical protein
VRLATVSEIQHTHVCRAPTASLSGLIKGWVRYSQETQLCHPFLFQASHVVRLAHARMVLKTCLRDLGQDVCSRVPNECKLGSQNLEHGHPQVQHQCLIMSHIATLTAE